MSRSITCTLVLALTGAVAHATPYWIAYEADGTFPEEEGWTRITHAGGAQRYFEDGALVLDGLASTQIVDFYEMYRPGALDPGPGETFVAQWRLRIDEVIGFSDPGIEVCSDEAWCVGFIFSADTVMSLLEPEVSAAFQPYTYHQFELRSSDMRSYELSMDGQPLLSGDFHQTLFPSRVGWGDAAQGGASLARWDYFRFEVVPEPGSLVLVGACASVFCLGRLASGTRRCVPVHGRAFGKEVPSCHER